MYVATHIMNVDILNFFENAKSELIPIYGIDETNAILNWVLEDCFTMKKHQIQLLNRLLMEEEILQLNTIVNRLKKHEPIQYILGYASFLNTRFKVNSSVLIPRPETEELVDLVIQHFNAHSQPISIIDIGTGSGCIAVSLAKSIQNANVFAIDVSAKALEIAQENALQMRTNIQFSKVDFIHDTNIFKNVQFDCIVSNPPYISQNESTNMNANVVAHEPHLALFVPNDDVLIFYKHLASFASERLKKGGILAVEINQKLGNETVDIFKIAGLTNIKLIKDMSGNNRLITSQKD